MERKEKREELFDRKNMVSERKFSKRTSQSAGKQKATMEERVNELAVAEKEYFTSVEEMDNCGKKTASEYVHR